MSSFELGSMISSFLTTSSVCDVQREMMSLSKVPYYSCSRGVKTVPVLTHYIK